MKNLLLFLSVMATATAFGQVNRVNASWDFTERPLGADNFELTFDFVACSECFFVWENTAPSAKLPKMSLELTSGNAELVGEISTDNTLEEVVSDTATIRKFVHEGSFKVKIKVTDKTKDVEGLISYVIGTATRLNPPRKFKFTFTP